MHLLSSGVQSASSTILPCPTRNQQVQAILVRRRPESEILVYSNFLLLIHSMLLTFFLNCLWMASKASLIVTPLRLRAVTSRPRGKCRSIFLTGGLVRNFFKASFSSTVAGEVLSFLCNQSIRICYSQEMMTECSVTGSSGYGRLQRSKRTEFAGLWTYRMSLPVQLLCFLGYL